MPHLASCSLRTAPRAVATRNSRLLFGVAEPKDVVALLELFLAAGALPCCRTSRQLPTSAVRNKFAAGHPLRPLLELRSSLVVNSSLSQEIGPACYCPREKRSRREGVPTHLRGHVQAPSLCCSMTSCTANKLHVHVFYPFTRMSCYHVYARDRKSRSGLDPSVDETN